MHSPSSSSSTNPKSLQKQGIAGRTDYATWEKRTSLLAKELDDQDEADRKQSSSALGLDGKHAWSQAEAEERAKAENATNTKRTFDSYQRREEAVAEVLWGLLDPLTSESEEDGQNENKGSKHSEVKYVTRDLLGAGKRVLTVSDTCGPGKIVLTQDLSNLESITPANSFLEPKSYDDDAENNVQHKEERTEQINDTHQKSHVHRGIIKLHLHSLHNCTIVIKCKIITNTIEISHCKNLQVVIEGDDATAATIQADLCTNLSIQFHDAPSGKNVPRLVRDSNSGPTTTLFWGQDAGDRIYHAGVSNLKVGIYQHGFLDLETTADYIKDGAKTMGNATAEEVAFVTSVVDGEFLTERVLKPGEGGGGGVNGSLPMTERERKKLEEKRVKIQEALDEKLKDVIQIKDGTNPVEKEKFPQCNDSSNKSVDDEVVEEVYTSSSKEEIDSIISYCEDEKSKGNEAFSSGKYAQAVLHYTLVLDRADELPDATIVKETLNSKPNPESPPLDQLFPRHILLSNRSASFLKLGHHEKALKDATDASILDPTYVKAMFRKGLALHAMARYQEAIVSLAAAQKFEPKNKQIKQALQFAEVRMTQEIRKRMQA